MRIQFGNCSLELTQGDITQQQVDAIVNAANSGLAGGGGVDGAIHRAAGPTVMEETDRRYPRGCETGRAVESAAGDLSARHIFHAVGPRWKGGREGEADQLASAIRSCLELAQAYSCESVAFPAISTGIYGYPIDLAAEVSLRATQDFVVEYGVPVLVRFVLFSEGSYGAFARALDDLVADAQA